MSARFGIFMANVSSGKSGGYPVVQTDLRRQPLSPISTNVAPMLA